jgi:hypothetical protein
MASTASPTSAENNMPIRTTTTSTTDEDAIPSEDSGEVSQLFHERLSAYKHATAYLEDYV